MACALIIDLPADNQREMKAPPGEYPITILGLSRPHLVTIEGFGEDGWTHLATIDATVAARKASTTLTVPLSRLVRASISGGSAKVMFLD